MERETAIALGVVLAPLMVAAAVVYGLLWRWLGAAAGQGLWGTLWVVAHGLAPLTLLLLKTLTPLGTPAAFPRGLSPLAWGEIAARFSPLAAGLVAVALLLGLTLAWLTVLVAFDALRTVLWPPTPAPDDADTEAMDLVA